MDLSLTSEQKTLADAARSLLGQHAPLEDIAEVVARPSGYDEELYTLMVELGWTSLGLADEDSTLLDLAVVLTQIGAFATPTPLPATVTAGLTLARIGEQAEVAEAIDAIAGGRLTTLVVGPRLSVETEGDATRLRGTTSAVEWAGAAEQFVVVTGSDERQLWLVDRADGVVVEPQEAMDDNRVGKVTFDGAAARGPLATVEPTTWREHVHLLRALRACDLVGISWRVRDMAVTHVLQREQFGKSLAMFQAVQHHLANASLDYEGSENLVHEALWLYSVELPFERQAAMAAWHTGEAAIRATQIANQLHGGVGFMKEYYLHHFFHRAIAQRSRMGTESERLGDLGDVVVEAAYRGYHSEFAEWPVLESPVHS